MTDSPRIAEVVARFAVPPEATMQQLLEVLDRNGEGVVMVLDEERRLLGLVTDGDIRRALLARMDFGVTAAAFLASKKAGGYERPLAMPADTAPDEIERLMRVRLVRHMPLVDGENRVVDLALQRYLSEGDNLAVQAVVMAGGFGTRLRPFTEATPKPLLKLGDRPVIEHIVGQLKAAGIRRVNITTHYHADKIRAHFGDGCAFGIDVRYTHEETPLGTAGALSMLDGADEPLLVVNGDVVTAVDFRALVEFHREQKADLTMAVRKYEVSVPFGVVEAEGARVIRLTEKPSLAFFINAGIYLLEPKVLRHLEAGRRLDMTDLIQRLLDDGTMVASFPIHEYWMDIGQVDDYLKASMAPELRRQGK
ncbi:MAG: nucleotidyltransferase family protein [Magnetospirillum sp. WYHS-4]